MPQHQPGLFSTGGDGPFAGVVLNRPVDGVFSYRVPKALASRLRPGARVRVPLGRGNNPITAYCVRVDNEPADDVDPERIKDVLDVLDDPPLIDASMLELTKWIASYYA